MKLIKKLKGLIGKVSHYYPYYPDSTRANSEDNQESTLKRTRLNRCTRPFSKTQSENEGPCHTKRFRCREKVNHCRWVLTVIEGNDRGRQFIGATPELKIGRQPENHICLRDPKVSRFHAIIKIKDSYLMIKDLQSTNGTIVNNLRVRRQKLQPGDQIKLGDSIIQVTLEKD